MVDLLDYLTTEVSIKATTEQLYFAIILLVLTFILISLAFLIFILKVRQGYSVLSEPFRYYFTIYLGIIFIVLNEIILLFWIIQTNQEFTLLGREKALIQIIGYGLFMYGWTNIVLFNISVSTGLKKVLRILFIGVMVFYIFAMTSTFLITFNLVSTKQFLGIGYEAAVLIYVSLLLGDLIALGYLANEKRKLSKFQFWLGIFLFIALLLQILSIIFNAIPAIINQQVSAETHSIWNFIIEPISYLISGPITLLLLYWVLFNPEWLERRTIEIES